MCRELYNIGLHISLGVFQRLFNLLQQECHKLDEQLAKQCKERWLGPISFDNYANDYVQIRMLEGELPGLRRHVAWLQETAACMSLTATDSSASEGSLYIIGQEVVKTNGQIENIVRIDT